MRKPCHWSSPQLNGNGDPELRLADNGRLFIRRDGQEIDIRPGVLHDSLPIMSNRSYDRMEYKVKLSQNGTIETWRKAAIKKQRGNWHHHFVYQLLDENMNTVFVDKETLTLGAKNDNWGRPENYEKDEHSIFANKISPEDAAKVRFILLVME